MPIVSKFSKTVSYNDLKDKPSIPSTLDHLADISLTTPAAGQIIQHDGASWVNVANPSYTKTEVDNAIAGAKGTTSIAGLTTDVALAETLTGGDVLKYNSVTAKWENAPSDGSLKLEAGSHAYWRLYLTQNDVSNASCYALEFRTTEGVAETPSGGTALGSSYYEAYMAVPQIYARAFDGDISTKWASASSTNKAGQYIGYHFATPKIVREVQICTDKFSWGTFEVQYSDDGITWTKVTSCANVTNTESGWTTFAVPVDYTTPAQARFTKMKINTPTTDQIIKYDGTNWINAANPSYTRAEVDTMFGNVESILTALGV